MKGQADSILDEAYKKISGRYEMYLKRTRLLTPLHRAAFLLYFASIILPPIFASLKLELPFLMPLALLEMPLFWMMCGVLVSILLLLFLPRFFSNRGRPYRTTSDERLFLNVYSTMRSLSSYLDDELEYHKADAFRSFEEVAERVSNWNYGNVGLVKKALGSYIRTFKKGVKEKLLPIIAEGDSEGYKMTLPVLKDFAKYLLEPTSTQLVELNKSIDTLPTFSYKRIVLTERIVSTLKTHVYLQHFIAATISIIVGISEFMIATQVFNISRDVSYAASITTTIGLFGSYSALRRKSS